MSFFSTFDLVVNMMSVLFVAIVISKVFCLTAPPDVKCTTSNAIFELQESTTTSFIIAHDENLCECLTEILKHYSKKARTVDISTLQQAKEPLEISPDHTVFLFWAIVDVQKFLNENFVLLAHSTSRVLLIIARDCENLGILSVWWMRFQIFNLLAYCSATNRVFLYNPFTSSTLNWDASNVSEDIFIKTTNLYGYPLKIYMFERIPTAVPLENVPTVLQHTITYKDLLKVVPFAGTDGFLLGELSQFLNFTPAFISLSTERIAYGAVFKNGTGIGLLGSITSRESDIAGNGLYMMDYHTNKLDFLLSYTEVSMCFIVPKAGAIPPWKLVFSCFTRLSWSFLFATVLLVSLLWKVFEGFLQQERYGTFYLLQFFITTTSRKPPAVSSKRLLILTCLFFNIIITSVFQGKLVTSYTKTVFYQDLNTLEDIDEAGLLVSTCIPNIFGYNLTGVRKNLEGKRVKSWQERSINRAAYKRDCCAVERKSDAAFNIDSMFISEDGTPLLHITDACDLNYPVTLAVVKGFSFADRFNIVIARFVEGGFIDKWNQDVTYSMTVRSRIKRNERGDAAKVIGIKEMKAAFYILGSGLLLSLVVFVMEIFKKYLW